MSTIPNGEGEDGVVEERLPASQQDSASRTGMSAHAYGTNLKDYETRVRSTYVACSRVKFKGHQPKQGKARLNVVRKQRKTNVEKVGWDREAKSDVPQQNGGRVILVQRDDASFAAGSLDAAAVVQTQSNHTVLPLSSMSPGMM